MSVQVVNSNKTTDVSICLIVKKDFLGMEKNVKLFPVFLDKPITENVDAVELLFTNVLLELTGTDIDVSSSPTSVQLV